MKSALEQYEDALISAGYTICQSGIHTTVSDPHDTDGFLLTGTDKEEVVTEAYNQLIAGTN